MPSLPSARIRSGPIASGSISGEHVLVEVGIDVDLLDEPPPGGSGSPASISARTSWIPASPDSARAPSRSSFTPVYALGLCEAVTIAPPSSSREPTR